MANLLVVSGIRIENSGVFALFRMLIVIIGLTVLLSAWVFASPLIGAQNLKHKLDQENLVILEIQPLTYYQQAHIPGSIHTDYADWRQTNAEGLGSMLPATTALTKLIGGMGIDAMSEVVIVPIGQRADDLAAATRIYWTLYVAGLDRLSILQGGLLAYFKTWGREGLESGVTRVEPMVFELRLRENEIMNSNKALDYVNQGFDIADARSPEEFGGEMVGSQHERPGALPGIEPHWSGLPRMN